MQAWRQQRWLTAALFVWGAWQFDWNEECEGGDCYKILEYHRDKFCNYKTTWRQVWWLIAQFLPWWMTGSGDVSCMAGLGGE